MHYSNLLCNLSLSDAEVVTSIGAFTWEYSPIMNVIKYRGFHFSVEFHFVSSMFFLTLFTNILKYKQNNNINNQFINKIGKTKRTQYK